MFKKQITAVMRPLVPPEILSHLSERKVNVYYNRHERQQRTEIFPFGFGEKLLAMLCPDQNSLV